ncbi:MAG: class I SAM-dependent methyltransferase [Bacillota bacterium]
MDTIEYYNQNAEEFYNNTVNVDMSQQYQEFLAHLNKGAHILDLGCGSGRDSLYFLEHGYQVTALDASKELVRLSSELINQQVLHLKFQELDFESEFDGIWACASLVHVNRAEIKEVFQNIIQAVVPNGVIYMSFKYGNQEFYRTGRLFNCYDEDSFKEIVDKFNSLEIIKLWKSSDARAERKEEYWLNILLKKIVK